MIRVLRIIEYTYSDNETAEKDMAMWKLGANDSLRAGGDKMIRSTIITDLTFVPQINKAGQELGINYDPTNPCLVRDSNGEIYGCAIHWNPHGIGECIVQFFDGSADSMLFSELNWVHGHNLARMALNVRER